MENENKYLKQLKIELVRSEYKNIVKGQLRGPEQLYNIFKNLKDKAQESLLVVYLNNDLEMLVYNVLSTGSRSETVADFNDIYGYGFMLKAKYFILIHNHPGGNPAPTDDDKNVIRKFRAYSEIDLKPLDFIIAGDMEMNDAGKAYWSMFEEMDGGEYSLGNALCT